MDIKRVVDRRSVSDLSAWVFRRSLGLLTARLRLLPDFIIIGAQRCGTTSLYKYLSQHPDVHPSFPKEIHYFSNHYQQGINWYRSHFPLQWRKKNNENNGKRAFITGEATPYYLAHPHAARRISQTLPQALLIVLLRDPVERAYSHYYHEVQMGVETLSFEDAIQKEAERLHQELEKMIGDENYRSFNYQHYSYLARGIYADQIQIWMRYFTPQAMLFLNSEKLESDPTKAYRMVTDFLGLRQWDQIDFTKYHASKYPPMDPKIRTQLANYFRPHNQRLSQIINVNFDLNQ